MWEEWETKTGSTERFRIIDGKIKVWRGKGWLTVEDGHEMSQWNRMWFRPQQGQEPKPWSVAPPDFLVKTIEYAKRGGQRLDPVRLWEALGLPVMAVSDRAEAWAMYNEVREDLGKDRNDNWRLGNAGMDAQAKGRE